MASLVRDLASPLNFGLAFSVGIVCRHRPDECGLFGKTQVLPRAPRRPFTSSLPGGW